MRAWIQIVTAALFILMANPALSIDTGPAFEDPAMQARYQRLIADIRCVTCQNQTIKDSNAFLASDLRREVRERMAAGASDQQIFDFLVERYGDFVLYRTPFNARTWIVWAFPPLLLLAGALIFMTTLRKRSALPIDDPVAENSE